MITTDVGTAEAEDDPAVLILHPHPCGESCRNAGGREHRGIRTARLKRMLISSGDTFEQAETCCDRWSYEIDETGTVRYDD